MKAAASGFIFLFLLLPFAAQSAENLVAKREACRQEARTRIAPLGKIGVDEFRRVVERRGAYVSRCMSRAVTVGTDPRSPPQQSLVVTTERARKRSAVAVQSKPPKIAKSLGRKKMKAASVKPGKVRKAGRKGSRRLTGRTK